MSDNTEFELDRMQRDIYTLLDDNATLRQHLADAQRERDAAKADADAMRAVVDATITWVATHREALEFTMNYADGGLVSKQVRDVVKAVDAYNARHGQGEKT